MKRLFAILALLVIVALAAVVFAGCTDAVDLEEAEARKYAAKAAAEAAPITAQVSVIEAETNAALLRLRAVADIDKEMRSFDAQMGRQEFATVVLEMDALTEAIRGNRQAMDEAIARLDAVSGVPEDAKEAADYSWLALLAIPISGVLTLGTLGILGVIGYQIVGRFDARLTNLEDRAPLQRGPTFSRKE